MNLPLQWFAVVASTTLINGLSFGFLAWREKHRALAFWSGAWFAWALAIVPLTFFEQQQPPPLAAVACGLLWVMSTLCFLSGAYHLAMRRLPRAWLAVAAVAVLVSIALALEHKSEVGMVPLVLFQSLGMMATGWLIVRRHHRFAGAWLCGVALIGLGLHVLDAPIASQRVSWLLWGFVLATALEVTTALGMLMLYYEQARVQLLQAQRALADTARMEALGRIAGGVAHDFNNMLTVMQGHLDLIRMDSRNKNVSAGSLEAMEGAVHQAGRLTSQLLAFGQRSVIQAQAVDVRRVVERTLELLRKVIPESIEVGCSTAPGDYAASLDRALLEQIVLNLVTNARDAISGVGKIDVELSRRTEPQPALVLRVSDDGNGMDDAVKRRIFEPFFTTKGGGRGTGLGLASVQGAVSQLGGTVQVESGPGKGTRFEIVLPWVATKESAAPHSGETRTRGCRILLVDDDEGVRNVTRKMLETGGHRVDEASDGAMALTKARECNYDVIISDVVMPLLGGVQLRLELQRMSPDTRVLLTSAYPRDEELDWQEDQFLAKPFQREVLLSTVARLVSARSRQAAVAVAD